MLNLPNQCLASCNIMVPWVHDFTRTIYTNGAAEAQRNSPSTSPESTDSAVLVNLILLSVSTVLTGGTEVS